MAAAAAEEEGENAVLRIRRLRGEPGWQTHALYRQSPTKLT